MIMGIIMSIISYIKFNRLLKNCEINETNYTSDSFEYKGKRYDTEKYIQLRVDAMFQLKPKHFREFARDAEKEIAKGRNVEQQQAELEAIKRAFAEYYPEKTFDY